MTVAPKPVGPRERPWQRAPSAGAAPPPNIVGLGCDYADDEFGLSAPPWKAFTSSLSPLEQAHYARARPKASRRPDGPGTSSNSSRPISFGTAGLTTSSPSRASRPSIARISSSGVPDAQACGLQAVGYSTG